MSYQEDLDRCFSYDTLASSSERVSPAQFAIEVCGTFISDGEVFIPALDPALKKLQRRYKSIVDNTNKDQPRLIGFEIDDMDCDDWLNAYSTSSRAAEFLRSRAMVQLFHHRKSPYGFRIFSCHLLLGKVEEPRQPNNRPTKTHSLTLLAYIADELKQSYGCKRGVGAAKLNRATALPICGATIAASALHAYGKTFNPANAAKHVAKHKKYLNGLDREDFRRAPMMGLGIGSIPRKPIGDELPNYISRARAYFDNWSNVYQNY